MTIKHNLSELTDEHLEDIKTTIGADENVTVVLLLRPSFADLSDEEFFRRIDYALSMKNPHIVIRDIDITLGMGGLLSAMSKLYWTNRLVEFAWDVQHVQAKIPEGYRAVGAVDILRYFMGPTFGFRPFEQTAHHALENLSRIGRNPDKDSVALAASAGGIPSNISQETEPADAAGLAVTFRAVTGTGPVVVCPGDDGDLLRRGEGHDLDWVKAFVEAGGLTGLSWLNPQSEPDKDKRTQQGLFANDMFDIASTYLWGRRGDCSGEAVYEVARLEAAFRQRAYKLLAESETLSGEWPALAYIARIASGAQRINPSRQPLAISNLFDADTGVRNLGDDLSQVTILMDALAARSLDSKAIVGEAMKAYDREVGGTPTRDGLDKLVMEIVAKHLTAPGGAS